jgi:hypothetical protein
MQGHGARAQKHARLLEAIVTMDTMPMVTRSVAKQVSRG